MPATKSRRRGTAELQVFVCDTSMALKLKMCVYIDKRWVRIPYNKNFLLKIWLFQIKVVFLPRYKTIGLWYMLMKQ